MLERQETSIYTVPQRIDGIEATPKRISKSAFKRSEDNLNKETKSLHDKFKSIDRLNRKPGAFLTEN